MPSSSAIGAETLFAWQRGLPRKRRPWPCGTHNKALARRATRASARRALRGAELLGCGCVEPLEPVAVVVDRHHAVTGLGLEVELLADLADVGIDGARGEIGAAAP